MGAYTISVSGGKVARAHDQRTRESVEKAREKNPNAFAHVNLDRVDDNITLVRCDNTRDAFNAVFADAVDAYNAKQRRKDRRVTDYYQACKDNKKMGDPILEDVVTIGNKDEHPDEAEAVVMLSEYFEQFRRDNPNMRVLWATIHVDEATPHLHMAYVGTSRGGKNGLGLKAGLDPALRELGYKATKKTDPSKVQWHADKMQALEQVICSHGHTRRLVDAPKRPREPVDVFKQNEQLRAENKRLQSQKSQLSNEIARDRKLVDELDTRARHAAAKRDTANEEVRQADERRRKAEVEARDILKRAREAEEAAQRQLALAQKAQGDVDRQRVEFERERDESRRVVAQTVREAADEREVFREGNRALSSAPDVGDIVDATLSELGRMCAPTRTPYGTQTPQKGVMGALSNIWGQVMRYLRDTLTMSGNTMLDVLKLNVEQHVSPARDYRVVEAERRLENDQKDTVFHI